MIDVLPHNKIMSILLAGQLSRSTDLKTTAHNIANAGTKGFHAAYTQKISKEYQLESDEKYTLPLDHINFITKEIGALTPSPSPYSVALKIPGFFGIQTPNGISYTRNGDFSVDDSGMLKTAHGHFVLDSEKNPIVIGQDISNFKILKDGTISVENKKIATLGVFNITGDIQEVGDNLLQSTKEPQKINNPTVMQNYLEESNVMLLQENMRLMEIVRDFEGMQHALSEYDQSKKRMLAISVKNGG